MEENLIKLVEDYYHADTRHKRYGKERNKLNLEIKEKFKEGTTEVMTREFGMIEVVKSVQHRTNMDDEVLLDILTEKGFTGAIDYVPKPNKEKLEQLIFQGDISTEDLQSALTVKEVEVLKLKPKK